MPAAPVTQLNSPSNGPSSTHPRKSSPSATPPPALSRKYSPSTPQTADFGPFFVRWANFFAHSPTIRPNRANFIPHAEPLPVQNSPCRPARRPNRYKTLPASGLGRPTRYKTLPARPKTLILAHFAPAGRTLYRFHHQQAEHGEKSHASTPHRTPTTHPFPNSACNSIA